MTHDGEKNLAAISIRETPDGIKDNFLTEVIAGYSLHLLVYFKCNCPGRLTNRRLSSFIQSFNILYGSYIAVKKDCLNIAG